MLKNYLAELKNILSQLNPYKAVLFGSSVRGEINDDSDIDLIVVLNKNQMPQNFDERIKNYSSVKNYFRSLKSKVPMDLIVYTIPEWEHFLEADNSFTRDVLEKGSFLV
ncbi:Nucleotidyltransferase domain-containing protein [Desulfonema limicola]|uniref:Nucleotidyltransferase domain-containing protein n=1 Tax=Desulfonema limicola TaxID=45656 RepID=A0A975B7D3_9BACT|nr:nucleotidyltransferase domain-containing protein [Desulfonema limicola]QTA80227.1 Nucleotidyltransferase domain-containing protein [Desulfonema limicola]